MCGVVYPGVVRGIVLDFLTVIPLMIYFLFQSVLFKLSFLMQSLTENNQRNINPRSYRDGNDKESHLFMQMLSEMSRDMEDF